MMYILSLDDEVIEETGIHWQLKDEMFGPCIAYKSQYI